MSSFCEHPRIGHLHRLQRIVAYLSQFRDFKIRFRTDQPDYSEVSGIELQDWKYTPYGNQKELVPEEPPKPLGKEIVITTYYDVNLMHDILSGKSVNGVIQMWNNTPMDW